ncbi:nitroreductase family protein [Candidatus Bathyarchaeota archaeon]|nr:nitroreductase family protein [Candidatus Bathyarchaeota archaeon]
MKALQVIKNRRSIRKYLDKKISNEEIKILLESAMAAPSAHNKQPWHFIVITKKEVLEEIPKFHPYSKMLLTASHAILVCGDLELEEGTGFWVQDCSAATQNILLSATALGSVWLGVYPQIVLVEGLKKLFNLPDNIVPFCIVSLGYPAEEKAQSNRFNENRIHIDKW